MASGDDKGMEFAKKTVGEGKDVGNWGWGMTVVGRDNVEGHDGIFETHFRKEG